MSDFYKKLIEQDEKTRNSINPIILEIIDYHMKAEGEDGWYESLEDQSDEEHKSYVYEWFTNNDMVVYVGKGKGSRINHIRYDEMKNNFWGPIYKHIEDTFGLNSRKVIEGLTDWEAEVYERHQIWKREKEGNVLLQFVDSSSYWNLDNDDNQLVNIMPYKRRYYGKTLDDYSFDVLDLSIIKGACIMYEDNALLHKLKNMGIKTYKTICPSVNAVFVDGVVNGDQYDKWKEQGLFIFHKTKIDNI